MRVIFHSKDFTSVEGLGFGFVNRRPMADAWSYRGRIQHRQWQGTFECSWAGASTSARSSTDLIWIAQGDARLFGLAAALKSSGFAVQVEQDANETREGR